MPMLDWQDEVCALVTLRGARMAATSGAHQAEEKQLCIFSRKADNRKIPVVLLADCHIALSQETSGGLSQVNTSNSPSHTQYLAHRELHRGHTDSRYVHSSLSRRLPGFRLPEQQKYKVSTDMAFKVVSFLLNTTSKTQFHFMITEKEN